MEEKIQKDNVEIAVVRTDTKLLETRTQEYVANIISTLAWKPIIKWVLCQYSSVIMYWSFHNEEL